MVNDMTHAIPVSSFNAPQPVDAAVIQVTGLIDQLIEIIGNENRQLERGVPAPLSDVIALKVSLAGEFECWVAKVRDQSIAIDDVDPRLRAHLIKRVSVLAHDMDENVARLQAAIEATRRRIEAVMRAVREQTETGGPYHANGRMGSRPIRTALHSGRLA
jgi:hypothetical protein